MRSASGVKCSSRVGCSRPLRIFLVASLAAGRLFAQEPRPEEDAGKDPPAVEEVGGRLVIRPEAVVVEADPDKPVLVSSIATKTSTDLLETPRSVSVLDRQTLDEIQVINVAQAHDYAAGITPVDERGPAFSRGFQIGFYDLRRDGLRTFTWSVREPVALDRIQYLRGPAALLYGDGSPGGLVNLVLKQPLPVPRYAASLGVGELGYRRATADVTGPIGASGAVRYRLVAAGEGLDNGFDNDESRLSVLPMLSFDIGDAAVLSLDGEFYDQRARGYAHLVPPTADGDLSSFPWDLNVASPDDSWRGWNLSGGLRLDLRLSEAAELHVAGRYTRIDGDLDIHGVAGLDPGARLLRRFRYRELSRWDEYQSDSFAVFPWGGSRVRHRLVAGIEAGLSLYDSQNGAGGAAAIPIDAPVYPPRGPTPGLSPEGSDLLRLGGYLQDQIQLGSRWTLVPGLRLSAFRLEDRATAAEPRTSDSVLNPALGAVFLPRPGISLYASWAEGFEPPAVGQRGEGGQALEPSRSRSLEAGIKAELLRQRLIVSAAGFGMRQTNIAEADALGVYRQIAEGTSRGVELEATGSPAAGLAIRAGYAWTRTEITRDLSGFAGHELPNAPGHQANLWVRYRISEGTLAPLALGAGVVHVAERFFDRANTIPIPAYTRFDATLSWEWREGRLGVALAGQNLTNTRYVTSGSIGAYWVGAPRRLAVTVTTSF